MRHVVRFDSRHHVSGICVELTRMMLSIDERDLKAKLNEHKSLIGVGSVGDGIANLIAGIFYILTAWTTDGLTMPLKVAFTACGSVIVVMGVAAILSKRLSASKLYKEIIAMNRRASSLIAVRDGADEQANRYLTYYDQQWECWFLPNHSSSGSYEEDKTKLIGYMTSEFKIPSDAFDVKFVGTSTSTKWSTEHQEERTYDYRLYLASVTHLPESWRTDGEFQVGSKRCRWMTVDDMIADPKINDINHDVIHMLKDSI